MIRAIMAVGLPIPVKDIKNPSRAMEGMV